MIFSMQHKDELGKSNLENAEKEFTNFYKHGYLYRKCFQLPIKTR